jgi:hypothetical protein
LNFDELTVLPTVTEDSADSAGASSKPSGKKKAAKKTPNRVSKPAKASKPFVIVSTPLQAEARSPTIEELVRKSEQQLSAAAGSGTKTASGHRKRLLDELEAEAEADSLDVRRTLPSSCLQSPSKKVKDAAAAAAAANSSL